jgi:hypothetical protein
MSRLSQEIGGKWPQADHPAGVAQKEIVSMLFMLRFD